MMVELMKRSWTRLSQKVEELSKSPKNLKGLKSCKDHWFGGMFTETPILRQFIDTKNSSSHQSFDSFVCKLFLQGPKALSRPLPLQLSTRGARKILETRKLESFAGCSPRWPPPMSRASTSSSSLTLPHRVFIYAAHVFSPLL